MKARNVKLGNALEQSMKGGDQMGDRIRLRRCKLGLSQEELAKQAGVSRAQISNLERGKSKNIQSKTAIAIAEVLNTTVTWILFGVYV